MTGVVVFDIKTAHALFESRCEKSEPRRKTILPLFASIFNPQLSASCVTCGRFSLELVPVNMIVELDMVFVRKKAGGGYIMRSPSSALSRLPQDHNENLVCEV